MLSVVLRPQAGFDNDLRSGAEKASLTYKTYYFPRSLPVRCTSSYYLIIALYNVPGACGMCLVLSLAFYGVVTLGFSCGYVIAARCQRGGVLPVPYTVVPVVIATAGSFYGFYYTTQHNTILLSAYVLDAFTHKSSTTPV